MNGSAVKHYMETAFPKDLAYEWDNVGLQIGTLNQTLKGIYVTLDVTKDAVHEAIEQGANVIIAHHPLLFKPLNHILSDQYKGKVIEMLLKNNIAVYVAHTNYDIAHGGMNDMLASKLGMEDIKVLEYTDETHGIGRIGAYGPKTLQATIEDIKTKLNLNDARLITNRSLDKKVKTLAISGGSGSHHMAMAKFKGADLYVTGDISYHQAHDMLQMGLSVLDVGHYAEKHFIPAIKEGLREAGIDVPIHESTINQDPFKTV